MNSYIERRQQDASSVLGKVAPCHERQPLAAHVVLLLLCLYVWVIVKTLIRVTNVTANIKRNEAQSLVRYEM